jgi:hypothetical protein
MTDTNQERKAQTIPALGRTLLDSRTTPTRGILTLGNQWQYISKCLEHRTAKEVLPMTLSFFVCSVSLFYKYQDDSGRATMGG